MPLSLSFKDSQNLWIEYGYNRNYYDLYSDKCMSMLQYFQDFSGEVIEISQEDFANGTYRITKPGYYKLISDISFCPNPKVSSNTKPGEINVLHNFSPTPQQLGTDEYPFMPYHLGFFAAITIEADGVILDLNGKTLSQHPMHYLQQRFFTCISLGSAPFITGQGPGNFGPFVPCRNVLIKNGFIGRSSHHSIHGNGMINVVLENLLLYNFEVAGLSLNGGENLLFRNLDISHNNQDVPVLASYSHAMFIRKFLQDLKTQEPSAVLQTKGGSKTIDQVISDLETEMIEKVYLKFLNNETITSELFKNSNNLADGANYGILLNPLGVAVENFRTSREGAVGNVDVVMHDIAIDHITSGPKEIIGISIDTDGTNVQKGPVGEVIRILECQDANGNYLPNTLSNAWFILGKYANSLTHTGSLNIPTSMTDWVEGNASLPKLPYSNLRDSMAHYMKGNIALFLSAVKNFKSSHVNIKNMVNTGELGDNQPLRVLDYNIVNTVGLNAGLHYKKYQGNKTRAVVIAGSENVDLDHLLIDTCGSTYGCAYGISSIGENANVDISNCNITGMYSNQDCNLLLLGDQILCGNIPDDYPTDTFTPNETSRVSNFISDHGCQCNLCQTSWSC